MINMGIIPSPFLIADFEAHYNLKDKILDKIKTMPNLNMDDQKECTVTKTDWHYDKYEDREYWKVLKKDMHELLLECFDIIHLDQWSYGNCWFQQYYKNDFHGWHRHPESLYNCVYYLELPEDGPKTVFRNPINYNEIITPEIKEGQVLIFPATISHTSPPNESNSRKTIIAFNVL